MYAHQTLRSTSPIDRSVGLRVDVTNPTPWMLAYFALTVVARLFPTPALGLSFGIANTITQTSLDLWILFTAYHLKDRLFASPLDRGWLLMGFASAAVADCIYGTAINILGATETHGTWTELAYNIPFNLFIMAMAVVLSRQILTVRSPARRALAVLVIPTTALLFYFYFFANPYVPESTQTYVLTGWSLLFEPAMLISAAVFFLFGITLPAQMAGGGILIIGAVNLFLQYLEFSGKLTSGIPFEAFWVLGQLSILVGLRSADHSPSSPQIQADFGFSNVRARFILRLVGLIALLHGCWHIFFASFGDDASLPSRIFLSWIFFSLALIPLTMLFRTLFIDPVLEILQSLYRSDRQLEPAPYLDPALRQATVAVLDRLLESERSRVRSEALAVLATQVAHDIRSPLSSLHCMMLSREMRALSPSSRDVVTGAISRIKEIADTLLERNRSSPLRAVTPLTDSSPSSQNLASLVQSAAVEWQTRFDSMPRIHFSVGLAPHAVGLFASVDPREFQRILSNLIQNAVEALGPMCGQIGIVLESSENEIRVRVTDNGVGIPTEILERLGTRGFTFGKTGGNGLGLHHAFETARSWGGRITIHSEPGYGAEFTIHLPMQPTPSWFVDHLDLTQRTRVVCIDDDPSVHQMWKRSLGAVRMHRDLEFRHFHSGLTWSEWWRESSNERSNTLFLVDYRLGEESRSGLDWIRLLNLQSDAILVTQDPSPDLQRELEAVPGLKLLPKNLASLVPVRY